MRGEVTKHFKAVAHSRALARRGVRNEVSPPAGNELSAKFGYALQKAAGEQKNSKDKKARRAVRGIFEKVPESRVWWIRYVDGHGRYRREKVGPYGLAVKLLAKRRTEAMTGKKLPETLRQKFTNFAEIANDALVYSKAHKRSWEDDESRLRRLKEWFGDHGAETLNGQEMETRLSDVANEERWAASTFNHYRSLLMLTYREARRAGKVTSNPARDIRHRKEDNNRVRYLSRCDEEGDKDKGEYARILRVLQSDCPEHVAEFIFALNTGLRLGSQYAATYEMIDFVRNRLSLPTSKSGEALHVPLNSAAMAAIRSLSSWQERKGPVFRNLNKPRRAVRSNDHWWKPALLKAGIANFRWHDIRHTFASWLVQDGVPLERVSKLLGHKSLAMTMRYAHLKPTQLHEDVELLANSTTLAPVPTSETRVTTTIVQ